MCRSKRVFRYVRIEGRAGDSHVKSRLFRQDRKCAKLLVYVFGLHPSVLSSGKTIVVPHAILGEYVGAWIWWRNYCTVVLVPEKMVAEVNRRVSTVEIEDLRDANTAAALLGNHAGAIIGPAYHGWLVQRTPGHEDSAVSEIPPTKIAELTNLAERDPRGWRDAGLYSAIDAAFGMNIAGQIVSVVAYRVDQLGAAFLSAFTHPDYRGQGLARAAAGVCVNHAISKGILCVYQTLLSNRSAVALARAVGFWEYGRHLAVRFT